MQSNYNSTKFSQGWYTKTGSVWNVLLAGITWPLEVFSTPATRPSVWSVLLEPCLNPVSLPCRLVYILKSLVEISRLKLVSRLVNILDKVEDVAWHQLWNSFYSPIKVSRRLPRIWTASTSSKTSFPQPCPKCVFSGSTSCYTPCSFTTTQGNQYDISPAGDTLIHNDRVSYPDQYGNTYHYRYLLKLCSLEGDLPLVTVRQIY